MALTNAQYDEIMRGYDKRQLQNKYIHDKRIEEAYRKAPRLREIDSEIASASVRQAYRLMDGDENALAALRLAIEDYKEERAALLSTLGYPLDYFHLSRLPRYRIHRRSEMSLFQAGYYQYRLFAVQYQGDFVS